LGKRNALKCSKNENIRDLWSDSSKSNVISDTLLLSLPLKEALKSQGKAQANKASDHFLGLESQGKIAKFVSELIPGKQIAAWSKSLDYLSGHIYNFVRKAMQTQLPTFANLHRWGRVPSNLCPMCGQVQTNKHVLSNCGSNGALSRYTQRHNKILKLLIDWLSAKLPCNSEVYHDLPLAGSKHISDLFNSLRPDIAVKTPNKVIILELTVCHETNLLSSRNYKLDKYKNIQHHRSEMIKHLPATVCTCEVSVLGFVNIEPQFLIECKLPSTDYSFLNNLSLSAISSSFDIYIERNT
jgi:hypothetical protein